MLHRALDVVFQHLLRLVTALILVPLGAGAVGLALDHSLTVEARVWADKPTFTPVFATDRFTSSDPPAEIEAGILRELLATSAFADAVLTRVESGYASASPSQRRSAAADLQSNVSVATEGTHLFTVIYRTTDSDRGRSVVNAIIAAFGTEVQAIDANQVGVSQAAVKSQLDVAQLDMNDAVRQVQTYQAQHSSVFNDPTYQTLLGQAQSKTDHYLSLQARLDEIKGSQAAVSVMQSSFFHVVDRPFVVPLTLDQHAPAVKFALYALIAIVAAEALFVYVIGRRDPRIRSMQDVRRAAGLKPLGSVPLLTRTR